MYIYTYIHTYVNTYSYIDYFKAYLTICIGRNIGNQDPYRNCPGDFPEAVLAQEVLAPKSSSLGSSDVMVMSLLEPLKIR